MFVYSTINMCSEFLKTKPNKASIITLYYYQSRLSAIEQTAATLINVEASSTRMQDNIPDAGNVFVIGGHILKF